VVREPTFKLIVNGKDVTLSVKPYFVGLEYSDSLDETADGFSIKFQGKDFNPPSFKDLLEVWIGYTGSDLWSIGIFSVLKSRIEFNTMEVEITGTPIDFGSKIKEKKTETFKKTTLQSILTTIANRNKLKLKYSFPTHTYTSKTNTNTSDLEFLKLLAKEVGATFSIKNNTLIFIQKPKTTNKDSIVFFLDVKQLDSLSFETINKTLYKSAIAKWHNTKSNSMLSTSVGSGSPVLNIQGHFQSVAEAKAFATGKLQNSNKGNIRGSFSMEGANIIAGTKLILNGLPSGWINSFSIKSVHHSLDHSGYICSLEIEN